MLTTVQLLFALTLVFATETVVATSSSIPIRRQLSGAGHEHKAHISALANIYARDEFQPVLSFSNAAVAYTTDVGVGNPPTTYSKSFTDPNNCLTTHYVFQR